MKFLKLQNHHNIAMASLLLENGKVIMYRMFSPLNVVGHL